MTFWQWWTPERVTALAVSAQVVVLVAAALFARNQVKESSKLRLAQARPYVVVTLRPDSVSPQFISMVVENLGTTAAHDVMLSFNPPFVSTFDEDDPDAPASRWHVLHEGIPTLAPGQQMAHLIEDFGAREKRSDLPMRHAVAVTYRAVLLDNNKPHTDTYVLDFGVWIGAHYIERHTIHEVAHQLGNVAKTLDGFKASRGGVRALVYDGAEEEAKARRGVEERRARRLESQDTANGGQGEK